MNFLIRNRILLLFTTAFIVLVVALFWPEPKKSGEMQKYYTRDASQLLSLRYRGAMSLGEKSKVLADYEILREENPVKPKEPFYRIQVHSVTTDDAALKSRVQVLAQAKTFPASALIRSIVQDWSALDFYYILPHDAAKDSEYGLQNCENSLQLKFKADERAFCIGTQSQGDTRRYILDRSKNKLLITPDYTVRRVLNNIFAQREQLLQPYGADAFDLLELNIAPAMLQKLPLLSEKTGGRMRLRMLVKKDGPAPVNVWHVENLLTIKPSHAAEFAQLLIAMRIPTAFAQPALAPDAQPKDLNNALGLAEQVQPAISGSLLLKKTDKQDILLTRYAFFAPGTRPGERRGIQADNQLVRPMDTLAVSSFNAGYITADLFPRFAAIFQKFENDLRDAVQAGKKEKSPEQAAPRKSPGKR
ncbi:MAG TPA: hypothetical protein PKY99_05740 [Turneriella sp.]|nr:hypothetical protein [Turneriella sp.]